MNPTRDQIITELAQEELIGDYNDFSRVATALAKGESREEILFRPELERWPGLFNFLRQRL